MRISDLDEVTALNCARDEMRMLLAAIERVQYPEHRTTLVSVRAVNRQTGSHTVMALNDTATNLTPDAVERIGASVSHAYKQAVRRELKSIEFKLEGLGVKLRDEPET